MGSVISYICEFVCPLDLCLPFLYFSVFEFIRYRYTMLYVVNVKFQTSTVANIHNWQCTVS